MILLGALTDKALGACAASVGFLMVQFVSIQHVPVQERRTTHLTHIRLGDHVMNIGKVVLEQILLVKTYTSRKKNHK